MTRISILQQQKDLVAAKEEKLNSELTEIRIRENAALIKVLVPFFKTFPEDVHIDIKRGGVYFTMDHPDYTYKKDLFNLSFKESWKDESPAYEGMELCYYTTRVSEGSVWELRRLQLLGVLSAIFQSSSKDMLNKMNEVAESFKSDYNQVYEQLRQVGQEERTIVNMMREIKAQQVKQDLLDVGVTFEKGAYINFKFNYTARVKSIKLQDVSKSGKTATVVFQFTHGDNWCTEENINVTKIVDQVLVSINSIVLAESV